MRIFLILVVVVGLFLILRPKNTPNEVLTTDFLLSEELVQYFVDELEQPIIDQLSQPIEGFTPAIFASQYGGISLEDFDGAEALQGTYVYINGTLEFQFEEGEIPHSAADTLTQEGMKTFLSNLAERNEVIVDTESEIDSLLETLQ